MGTRIFKPYEDISIHALREEGDTTRTSGQRYSWEFLSTPSARRATGQSVKQSNRRIYFYPRPPRGGRLSGARALPGR